MGKTGRAFFFLSEPRPREVSQWDAPGRVELQAGNITSGGILDLISQSQKHHEEALEKVVEHDCIKLQEGNAQERQEPPVSVAIIGDYKSVGLLADFLRLPTEKCEAEIAILIQRG